MTIRSTFADYFNHDPDASGYDQDIANESHPIRAGYEATLSWVGSRVTAPAAVLDLGAGTGNTIRKLPQRCRVTAVDISQNMVNIAKTKLNGRQVTFVIDDILHYVAANDLSGFDAIVSTYALHHLTPGERATLFELIHAKTKTAVRVVVGDLMYQNAADRRRIIEKFQPTHPGIAADFADEFFWNVEETEKAMKEIGWGTEWKRFSDLFWAGAFRKEKSSNG